MKNIYKLIILTTITLATSAILSLVLPSTGAYAANTVTCGNKEKVEIKSWMGQGEIDGLCKGKDAPTSSSSDTSLPAGDSPTDTNSGKSSSADSGLKCNILPKVICDAADAGAGEDGADVKNTGIFQLLIWVLRIMTAVVGIAAIGAIVYAGIMYSSAGDDSAQVSKAKNLIRDTVIGLIVYGLMFLILNFLVPGGVIG